MKSLLTRLGIPGHELVLAGALAVTFAIIAFAAPGYMNVGNLMNQARFMSELGLIALAMTLILLTGGIDLSVGAIFGLVTVTLGLLWQTDAFTITQVALLALVVGVIAGAFNGLIVTITALPPFIVTLGTLALFRGLAEGLAQGRSVGGFPESFHMLGQGTWLGMPTQALVFILAAVVMWLLVERTPFGQAIRTTGYNSEAAFFSGVNVRLVRFTVYTIAGFMAALSAVLYVSRVTTTRSDMGLGLELEAITVVVLGGTSVFGGRGGIVGTLLALMIVQLLKSGLSLMGVRGDGTVFIIGAVLIVTVLLANFFTRTERA